MMILDNIFGFCAYFSLLFLIYYSYSIIGNYCNILKRKMFGEEPKPKTWNPFELIFDKKKYGEGYIIYFVKPFFIICFIYTIVYIILSNGKPIIILVKFFDRLKIYITN